MQLPRNPVQQLRKIGLILLPIHKKSMAHAMLNKIVKNKLVSEN